MTNRERVDAALSFQETDRIPLHDNPWGPTVERWHQEGLPAEVSPADYFDYAMIRADVDWTFQLPTEVIEETERHTITRDSDGATLKNWKDAYTTPGMLDFLIKTRSDWEQYKPRLAWNRQRVDWEYVRKLEQEARAKGRWFNFRGVFGYDRIQMVVGSEQLLLSMIEDPEWVDDMFATYTRLVIAAAEEMMAAGIEFDGAFVYDDMGYRGASLFSPAMFRRFEFPNHKLIYDFFHARGLKVILHSCGYVKELIPGLLEAGLDCLQPLEVKAGMDLPELKHEYGDQLAFMGGIDARCMADPNPAIIEEEIATKIPVAKVGGGYIYHSDHSVPDNVSFSQYQHIINLVHKYGSY